MVIGGRKLVNYVIYNYLGMCGDFFVFNVVKEVINCYGIFVFVSRLLLGEKFLY